MCRTERPAGVGRAAAGKGAALLLAALLVLAGCGGGGSLVGFDDASIVIAFDATGAMDARDGVSDLVETSDAPDGSEARCVDRDNDRYGFGPGCLNVDCDDDDPSVTDQCYCDRPPNTRAGCGCRIGELPRPCDVDSGRAYSATDTCNVGQRSCDPLPGSPEQGRWSECRAWRPDYPTPTRFVGVVSPCAGSCSPQCRHQVICPESGDAIPAGSTNVAVANAAHAVFCPGGAGLRGGITATCTSASGGSYTRGASPLSWRDACAAPGHQTILANSDDGTTQLPLPFTFRFYGASYATAGIATNGMISFVDPTYWWVNSGLPTGDVANTIFAFWDDVYNRGNGECIAVYGSAPGREYVVQWSDQFFYPPGSSSATEHLTYQVVLAETTHTIDVLYNQMEGQGDRATGNSATIGIQQGTGSSFDLVGNNSAGVTPAGRTLRWTPSAGSTVCSIGTYRRVYEGTSCTGLDAPYWGQFNFSSIVPQGTSIEFRARVAQTSAGLAGAPWTRLANAPNGAPSAPSSLDVGAAIRAARPTAVGADHLPFLELQATLIPSPDGTLAPTLISTEVQFTCAPPEEVVCRVGAPCYIASDPCRRGVIQCLNSMGGRPVESCVDAGALPPGTVCGVGSVCNASGACVPCSEGAACNTGLACATGRLSCATGSPACAIASQLPVGTLCGAGVDVYTRLRPSPMPWVDVCSLAGHRTFMTGSDDGTTGEPLAFTFRFYGSPYSYVGIASNGQLSFVLPTYSWVNSTLPTSAVENTIFGFWDDIYQRNGICTATVGAAPLRRYIAEWEDNFFYPPGSSNASEHVTFEISLSEGSNAIDVLYDRMEGQGDRGTGGDATIGLQRDTGSAFDLLGFNTAGVASGGSSVRWLPGSSSVCNAMAACVACANGAPCTLPGVCVIGVLDCSTGAPVCTNAGTRAPTAESCNGVDDDCDGVIDDGVSQGCYSGASGTSGVGVCHAGSQSCSAGAWGACVGQVVPGTESCNGVDDDCDGVLDDGVSQGCYTGAVGTLGVGVCRAGTRSCSVGAWGACSGQVVPGAEVCNSLDDNCNGVVDDGVSQGCYTGPAGTSGVGLCRAGLQSCSMGAWGVCSSQVTPRTEVCNNLDDDCNGAIDNGVAQTCYTGPAGTRLVGRCRDGLQSCATGAWGACAGQVVPAAESCNGIDDDCDGAVDEGLGTTSCGSGLCQRTVDNCVGGVVQVCVPGGSGTEVCNNLDDDCDGAVDEGLAQACYSGPAGTSGVGLCRSGAQSCVAGSWGSSCTGEVVPAMEVCDGQDNNCNASVDEGLGLTSCGVGVCARTVATCLNGTPQSCLPTGPATTGRGLDGALGVASGATATIDTVRTPVSGAAGSTSLSLGSAAGFSAGRLVLVHQSQGAGAGTYEIRQIRALVGTTATIDTALLGTYSSAGSSRAQAVLVPEYTNVTVASGGTLVAPSWDGSTGGILVYLASGTVTIDGAVSMSGRGFRGTQHACFNRCATGVQGESSLGGGGGATGANGGGGGGGSRGQDCAAGGGGAYGSAGGAGATGSGLGGCGAGTSSQPGGAGGSAVGSSLDTALLFGGAGGEGGGDEDGAFAGSGGGGGGIVFMRGAQLLLRGTVSASGGAGGDGNNGACGGVGCGMGGGGGGAGGAIWLESTLSATLSGVVTSGGGVGGSCTCGGAYSGGVGGVGRIAVRAPSVSGSSSPAWAPGASIASRVSVPGTTSAESCNGLDDDCNGIVDDGNPGAGASCDTGQAGVCASGTTACSAGGIACNRNVGPSAELCDGLDNDCDGAVDEGYCRIGGVCFTSGQINPANNCQLCVVASSTVSGPTSWGSVAAGTVCRAAAGVCDVAESCNGSGAACPANGYVASGTVCRAAMGVCDVAESCDGASAACPANGFVPSSVVCRASSSIAACDPAESCTGSSALCPTNVITRSPTTELCDAIDNDCDGVVDGPWIRPSGCVPGVELCDRVDNDCDGLVDEGLAGSASCPGRSCEDIYAATMSVGSGYYWLNPTSASTAGRFEAWCDMVADGSGWTLVGRSRPGGWGPGCAGGDGGASFGWRSAQGAVRNDAAAYSLNAFGVGLPVTQMLFGSYVGAKSWGANVFRHTVPSNFVSAWGGSEFFNGTPATVAGPCAPGMFGWIGYTAATDQFHLRDVPGGSFGLTASGWASCYDASCYAGNLNGSQGQIMVRAPAISYGYLAGACTVGVGACARVGALMCTADGRGTACSATAGSPGAELCDGLDNDCNGLVDEGYCRIGGACFTSGQINPANNCQVCVVPSTTVSGPTSWSGVAAGTVCRAAAGVCDVAESCDGSGAACPANGFIASGTVCRAAVGVCDAAESCTGSSGPCPADGFLPSSTVCRANNGGGCDVAENCTGSAATCPADLGVAAGTVCRASAGVCDPAEACTGSSAACPGNALTAAGVVCRSAVGVCDVAEACTGASSACPADSVAPGGTSFPSNGSNGAFAPVANTVLAPGVYHFTTITIPSGVTVRTSGTGTLDLRATGAITIAGAIDVSGARGGDGAAVGCYVGGGGGGATGNVSALGPSGGGSCYAGGTGGLGSAGGGGPGRSCTAGGGGYGGGSGGGVCDSGGGGGGYGGGGGGGAWYIGDGGSGGGAYGGAGGASAQGAGLGGVSPGVYAGGNATTGSCSYYAGGGGGGAIGSDAAADLAMATTFRPGSAGGGGGGECANCGWHGGGGGGGGGGALRLATSGAMTITGALRANGGAGGNTALGSGAGGGGSGGAVYLEAPTLSVSGTVQAVGGGGGVGGGGCVNNGGAGGLGRIRISATVASCSLSGSFSPPLVSGCNPGSAAGRVHVTALVGGTVCRPSAGPCDVAEACDGSSSGCPADGFTAAGTVCRASAGVCDVAESCTGASTACPADALTAAGTVCRGSAGACDVAESCTGASAACPGNALTAAGVVCRSSSGVCDVAEACTGASATCPADTVAPGGTSFPSNGSNGAFSPVANTVLAPGVYHFTTITIPSGVTVSTSGTGTLDLRATGAVTIAGAIDVSGSRGGNGAAYGGCDQGATGGGGASGTPNAPGLNGLVGCPGAGAGGSGAVGGTSAAGRYCNNPGGSFGGGAGGGICEGGGGGGGYAGGGGSGSYAGYNGGAGGSAGGSSGGAGGTGSAGGGGTGGAGGAASGVYVGGTGGRSAACDTWAAGGGGGGSIGAVASADLAVATTFYPGSGGGGGGGPCTCSKPGGGGGGGGGGALRIATASTMTVTGSLRANGGAGGASLQGASGGGGGSGGVVFLEAPSLTVSGTVQSVGGAGGSSSGCGIDGGAGGLGRIRIGAVTATCSLTGSFNPPLAAGCSPSGAVAGRAYVTALVVGTVCRPSADVCDLAETCDGSSVGCPANGFVTAGAVCRGSVGACDPAETCNGSSAACPANGFTAAGTVCRGSAGVCDVAETCNGASGLCPADGFQSSATVCRGSSSIAACDPAESCTGSSALCPTNVITRSPTTEVCNGVDDDCDGAVDDIASSSCSPGECRTGYTYCSGASTLCAWSGNLPVGTGCSLGRCDGAGTCRPPNDRPEYATYLGSLPGGQLLTSGNTCGASTQSSAWCNGQAEVYYYVYVTQRSVLYVDTFGSTFDTVLNVSSDGYNSYFCNDDSCGTLQSQIAPGSPFVVNPGYYYIAVGGFVGSCGNFTLRVQAIPASNPVIQVPRGAGQVAYYSTAGQANMVNLGCGATGGDITFYWTLCPGVGGGTFSANTCSGYTSYDTVAEFFDGTSGYAGCNDDSCGLRSSLSVGVNVGPGIRAFYEDGWGGGTGNNYTVFSIP